MAVLFLRFMGIHKVDRNATICCIEETAPYYISKEICLALDKNNQFKVQSDSGLY